MSVRQDSGGRWYFRVWARTPAGERVRLFGTPKEWGLPKTKAGAKEAEQRAIAQVAGKVVAPDVIAAAAPPVTSGPTLNEYAETYLSLLSGRASNKPSTVETKRQILDDHLLPTLGHVPIDRITYKRIEDLDMTLAKRLSTKTRNNVWSVLRHLYKVAVKRGDVNDAPETPWTTVKATKAPDYLTFDEAGALLLGAAREPLWHAMILTGLQTGLRHGELLGLQWGDVDTRAGRLLVQRAVARGRLGTPKSGKTRELQMPDLLAAELEERRRARRGSPWVFADGEGGMLTRGACKHPLWRACRRAGLRRIGWHVLRHSYASHLVMRGVPLFTVSRLMGHSSIKMTERYAHLAPVVGREAVRVLDGIYTAGQNLGRQAVAPLPGSETTWRSN